MLRFGPVQLATNLLLAPIAGYCDLAFRTICREWGGVGLACTDLLSPQGLLRGTSASLDLAKTNAFDKPVGMQLYGSDPDIMAEGARWAVEHGATVVDINMGCPVDKVTKKDGGSKLLTDLPRAARIVERVTRELEKCPLSAEEWGRRLGDATMPRGGGEDEEVKRWGGEEVNGHHVPSPHPLIASSPQPHLTSSPVHLFTSSSPVPLTCKIRLCWHTADYDAGSACSPGLACALADAGVAGVTVHGRTTEDKFSGSVRLAGIARVVEAVNGRIPIIGNGDVLEPEDAARMLSETGCSGVMIGRGALSTPWIFRDTAEFLRTGRKPAAPTEEQIIAMIRRYFELMRAHRDDKYALMQINRRVTWFAKRLGNLPDGSRVGVKPFKEAVRVARTADEVYAALDLYLAGGLRGGPREREEAGV